MKKIIYNPDLECEHITERIRDICKLRRMSCYTIAKIAEMSTSSVYSILIGKTRPSIHTVYKLCNALGITLEELLGIESDNTDMTLEEFWIIKQYRCFTDRDKKMLRLYLDMIEKMEEMEKD